VRCAGCLNSTQAPPLASSRWRGGVAWQGCVWRVCGLGSGSGECTSHALLESYHERAFSSGSRRPLPRGRCARTPSPPSHPPLAVWAMPFIARRAGARARSPGSRACAGFGQRRFVLPSFVLLSLPPHAHTTPAPHPRAPKPDAPAIGKCNALTSMKKTPTPGVPLKVGRALEGMPTHGQVPWLRALSGVSCSARAAAGWTAGVARTVDRLGLEAVCAAGWPGPPRCGVGGRDIFCGGVVCFPLE
jgi:hypothetical protein